MTREEIVKAADEAVDMFKTPIDESDFHVPEYISSVSHLSDEYAKVLESETNSVALQGAIIHYEKILELRIVFLERIQYLHEEGDLTNYVLICKDEVIDAESILTELKSRL